MWWPTPGGRDRGSIFPFAMVVLSFVVFVPAWIALLAAWPDMHTAALDGTTNQDALNAIGWYDLFITAMGPFAWLAMVFVYFNVRATRDAGRV